MMDVRDSNAGHGVALPRQIAQECEQADRLQEAFERAALMGEAMEEIFRQYNSATPEQREQMVHDINRRYYAFPGRLRDAPEPKQPVTLWEQSQALVERARLRAVGGFYHEWLFTDAVFCAVVELREAMDVEATKPRGRGRPSVPNSEHGRRFIRAIALAWEAFVGRTARGGDGRATASGNFNGFLSEAFSIVGVRVHPTSLGANIRNALAGGLSSR